MMMGRVEHYMVLGDFEFYNPSIDILNMWTNEQDVWVNPRNILFTYNNENKLLEGKLMSHFVFF